MNNKGNILRHFFNTPEEYLNLKIDVSERVLDVADILIENKIRMLSETPATEQQFAAPGEGGFDMGAILAIGAADIPQEERDRQIAAIMDDWATKKVHAIRQMEPDDLRLVFGVGFFDSFKVDWISTLMADMGFGVEDSNFNIIMSQMVLHVGHDRWVDVIQNWKRPCRCLSDMDNTDGQRGCDVIATGMLKGIMYLIGGSSAGISAKKFTQLFKANPAIFAAIFAVG